MEQFYLMLEVQAMLFVYMLAGFYAEKKEIMTPSSRKGMTDFLVGILLPCMVFESFNQEFSIEKLKTGGMMVIIAFGLGFLAIGLGKLCWQKFPPEKRGVLQYGTLVANSGFAGLAVISGAYGGEGVFLASLFIIPNRIFMWTAGISMFTTVESESKMKTILTNPAIIAVFLGLARMVLQIPVPHFFDSAIGALGACTAPISMVIIGGILYYIDWRSIFQLDTFLLSGVRLVILPLIALVLMNAFAFPPLETAVAVILTGMPAASTTAILAEKYGANGKFASQCVFVSTLLSLATVPLLTLLLP